MQGLAVPNLEDPAAPLQQIGNVSQPACLAPIAPSWLPRRAFAGTYDERWQRARAPYLPDDFDPRFFQCAAPEFAFDRYLQTGEHVQIVGALPDGPIAFTIPESHLSIAVTIEGSPHHPPANLETLSIEPDENRACFTWRAAVPCDRRALKVQDDRGEPGMSAVIGATHVLCAIGRGTDQVWASARAGVARIGNSHVMDRYFEPIQMGLVPEDGLGRTLTPEIDELPLPSRARRMLRLAAPSFQAVAKDVGRPVPVFIGLPALTPAEAPWIVHVPAYLQKLTNVPIDLQRSAIVPHGRAAGLMALELAMSAIATDPTATVVVGGVDTYLDLRLSRRAG